MLLQIAATISKNDSIDVSSHMLVLSAVISHLWVAGPQLQSGALLAAAWSCAYASGRPVALAWLYCMFRAPEPCTTTHNSVQQFHPVCKGQGVLVLQIYVLAYAVMLGASSVFSSSFGYQTNLMALAAGSYSSRDFLKFGTPMQVGSIAVW